jgi:hypothetical protein
MTTYKERRRGGRNPLSGGKLPVKEIEMFLNESYNPEPISEIGNFKLVDTTETTRTYWNGSQCVFVIRGTNPTMKDWRNNLSSAFSLKFFIFCWVFILFFYFFYLIFIN